MHTLRTLAFKIALSWMLLTLIMFRRVFKLQPRTLRSHKKPFLLGHRGARSEAPENSLLAFKTAFEVGADGVELDVFLSVDGHSVVVHDRTLERLCLVPVDVCTQTREQLTALELVTSDGRKTGQHIPTLRAVFDAMPNGAIVNVELKNAGKFSSSYFVRRVLQDYEPHAGRFEVILSSFNPLLLLAAQRERIPFVRGLLAAPDEMSWLATWLLGPFLGAGTIHLHESLASPHVIGLAHRAGLKVVYWTVNNESEALSLRGLGVDGIISDNPRLMSRAMKT